MQNYSPNLIIASTVFGIFIIFGFFNALFLLRKRFPIRVNCWFCNSNLRVPYNDWNSFTCPKCEQYNGFTDDGDYNKEISAQFSSKFNSNAFCQRTTADARLPPSNGFCEFCSRNQEIKVIQLANFRPRCESTYDQEIEEFRQKLEDSYQLCQQCQRHVNKTLNRVKTKFIGSKITQLRAKEKKLNQSAKVILDDGKFLSSMLMTSILLLSIANFFRDLQVELPDFSFSDRLSEFYSHLQAFLITMGDILMSSFKELGLSGMLEDANIDGIATSALTLNSLLILRDRKNIQGRAVASMLLWAVKMITNEIEIKGSYVLAVNGAVATALIASSLFLFKKTDKKDDHNISKNTSFRKIVTDDIVDESDAENDISDANSSFFDLQSTRTAINSHSSKLNSSYRPSVVKPCKTLNSTIRNASNVDAWSDRSFNITKEVMAADRTQVQNDITRLQLNDEVTALSTSSTIRDFSGAATAAQCLNPFALERASRPGSPTPSMVSMFSVSNRTQMISPPRLHSPQVYASSTAPSWIAGGYWQSPPKKFLNSLQPSHTAMSSMISRSSSQSSGLGTLGDGSDKNSVSCENSLTQEDVFSVFSDATGNGARKSFFEQPSSRTLFPETQFFSQPKSRGNLFNSSFSGNNSFRNYRESKRFFE